VAEPKDDVLKTAREALRLAAQRHTEAQKLPKTKSQKIRELRGDIAKLRTQGLTWQQIADALRGSVDASPEMLRLTIGVKKAKKKPPATVSRAAHKPKPPREASPAAPASDTTFGRRKL